MEWTITLGNETIKLKLPAELVAGQRLVAQLPDGATVEFTWEESLKTLALRQGPGGLERCLSLRSQRIQRLSTSAAYEVDLEVTAMPASTIKASASPLAFGEAARQSRQEEKGVTVRSPMTGKVLQVLASKGDQVAGGETLLIIEAMKMENKIFAPKGGKVEELRVKAGDLVQVGAVLAVIQN